jgi:hypothetical protein
MEDAFSFIVYAYEKNDEELLFQRWIYGYQFNISFEQFKAEIKERAKPPKNEDEILKDVKAIITLFNTKGGQNGAI